MIVKGWKPLTIITKCSIVDVAAVVDPPLTIVNSLTHFRSMFSFLKISEN